MITARELRSKMAGTPFRPFRVYLSDGSHHDVPHPEFAWVFGGSIFVGKPGTLGIQGTSHVRQLSILHISRLEPLSARKAKTKSAKRRRA